MDYPKFEGIDKFVCFFWKREDWRAQTGHGTLHGVEPMVDPSR